MSRPNTTESPSLSQIGTVQCRQRLGPWFHWTSQGVTRLGNMSMDQMLLREIQTTNHLLKQMISMMESASDAADSDGSQEMSEKSEPRYLDGSR